MGALKLSVKQKLISITVLVIIAILGMLALQTYSTNSVLSLEKDIELTNDIQISMLNLRRAEKDFLARLDMKYVDKFDKHYARMQDDITSLDNALQHAGIDTATLATSKVALDKYTRTFHQLINTQQLIGLNPKDGLYGSLRNAVHNAEALIKELKDHQLMADMLMLRRREKDFMLRENEKYIGKFNKDFAKLETHLAERNFSEETRTAISGAMQSYQQDFLKLFNGYKEKGLDSESGLRGNMRAAVHDAEESLNTMKSQISLAVEKHIGRLNIIAWVITIALSITIIALIVLIARSIITPIKSLSHIMDEASHDKNLTVRSDLKGSDEISAMAYAFNDMMETFHDMLAHVVNTSNEAHAAAEHLSTINSLTADGVNRQHAESDQVSTAMNEMTATVQEVSKQAQDAAHASNNADQKASEGKQIVAENNRGIHQLVQQIENTSSAIYQLSDESKNIGSVLQVIRDIAEQTNLLALNAAIEAARAGEQGRGFAVVADEVRNLAQRSHKSTEEIQEIVERLQTKATDAVSAMGSGQEEANNSVERAEQVGQALDNILGEISAISSMNTQIASAAEEQSSVAEEINRSIVEIAQISNQTAEGATEATNTSNSLANMSEQLNTLVNQFKL